MTSDQIREQIAERLRKWDAGEPIQTVEMGGIGPGYEQAIQILAIEILRDWNDNPPKSDEDWKIFGDSTVLRIDTRDADGNHAMGGFSGAQVGAARNLAANLLKRGEEALGDDSVKTRLILISKFWPRVNEGRA